MRRLAVALVHHPVLDREGGTVTTAITNLDLHDFARSSRTYAVERVYVVHPVHAQRALTLRIREHWATGAGGRRFPTRARALELLEPVESIDEALALHGGAERAELWTTSAARGTVAWRDARATLEGEGAPVLLAFGTGWGLAADVMERAAVCIEPLRSASGDGYNHLSVRSACAIALDRLRGA